MGDQGISLFHLHLLGGDSAQLWNVFDVETVGHRCGEADMQFHQEVGCHMYIEALGEVGHLEPERDASHTRCVHLNDSNCPRCQVLTKVAETLDNLTHNDGDAAASSAPLTTTSPLVRLPR